MSRLDAVLAAIFLAAVTGGTVLTFDASLPWVYHEVYLWPTASWSAAMYWMVRVALDPTTHGGAAGSAWSRSCAVLTRTTGGWGVCLGIARAGGVDALGPHPPATPRTVAAALLADRGRSPLAIGDRPQPGQVRPPLPVPAAASRCGPRSTRTGARPCGSTAARIAGPQFFLTSLVNYFRPGGIRFVDYFPWITLPAEPRAGVRRRVHRPVLPDRQRHGVLTLAAAVAGPAGDPCAAARRMPAALAPPGAPAARRRS